MKINILSINTNNCFASTKIQYDTVEEAEPYLKLMIRKTKIDSYTIYKCKYCKKYHIGHLHHGKYRILRK